MLVLISLSDLSDISTEVVGAALASERNAAPLRPVILLFFDKLVSTEALSPCVVFIPGGGRGCGSHVVGPQRAIV